MRTSGFNPDDNICWQFGNKGDRSWRCKCPACIGRYDTRESATFGRCRSGKQWFWYAGMGYLEGARKVTGYVDTEDQAIDAAMAVIRSFRGRLPIVAHVSHGCASRELKHINEGKRRAKPSSGATDSRVIEYLYSGSRSDYSGELLLRRFAITKKTAKRIYYLRCPEQIDEHGELREDFKFRDLNSGGTGFVDRIKLEAKGNIYSSHKWCQDWDLYTTLDGLIADYTRHDYKPPGPADLAALKEAMANAHPDRGGSNAAFIEARAAYVAARRMQRGAA